jgi:hypothetical protein
VIQIPKDPGVVIDGLKDLIRTARQFADSTRRPLKRPLRDISRPCRGLIHGFPGGIHGVRGVVTETGYPLINPIGEGLGGL